MTRNITVAAIQTSYGLDMKANIDKTVHFVRAAAKDGAQVILPSELFQNIYFCNSQDPRWFAEAYPVDQHPAVKELQKVAKDLGAFTARRIFLTARVIRRSITSGLAIWDSRFGIRNSEKSASAFVGINGIRKSRAP